MHRKKRYVYGPINLQDAILCEAIEEKIPVDLLLKRHQIGGFIVAYDSFIQSAFVKKQKRT